MHVKPLDKYDIRKLYEEGRLMHDTVSNLPVWTVYYARTADLGCCRPSTRLSCSSGEIMEQVGRLAEQCMGNVTR